MTESVTSVRNDGIRHPAVVPYPNRQERAMRRHKVISYVKSGVRIGASFLFIAGHFTAGAIVLIIAEIGGIVEEVYGS